MKELLTFRVPEIRISSPWTAERGTADLLTFFLLVFLYLEEGRKLTLTAFKPLAGVQEVKNNALFEKNRSLYSSKTLISTVKGYYPRSCLPTFYQFIPSSVSTW